MSISFRNHLVPVYRQVMSMSLRNKRSLTDKIDSNKSENAEKFVKKRKHLTVKSTTTNNGETSSTDVWSPPDWKQTVENIRKMRKDVVAPVDEMGCDQAADTNESPEVYLFLCILCAMNNNELIEK